MNQNRQWQLTKERRWRSVGEWSAAIHRERLLTIDWLFGIYIFTFSVIDRQIYRLFFLVAALFFSILISNVKINCDVNTLLFFFCSNSLSFVLSLVLFVVLLHRRFYFILIYNAFEMFPENFQFDTFQTFVLFLSALSHTLSLHFPFGSSLTFAFCLSPTTSKVSIAKLNDVYVCERRNTERRSGAKQHQKCWEWTAINTYLNIIN